MVEQRFCKPLVGGSNPSAGFDVVSGRIGWPAWNTAVFPFGQGVLKVPRGRNPAGIEFGGIPKRSNGTDCKSVGSRLRRFESCSPHYEKVARKAIIRDRPPGFSGKRHLFVDFEFLVGFRNFLAVKFAIPVRARFEQLRIFGTLSRLSPRTGGCSSMAEPQPSKLVVRVRFPSPALSAKACLAE